MRFMSISLVMFWLSAGLSAGENPHGLPVPKKLTRGINLGNFLEVPPGEKWAITLDEDILRFVAEAGFDHIRLPVKWSAYAEAQPPYRIDEKLLMRVRRIVELCRKQKLAVVLNVHHYDEIHKDPKGHEARLEGIWEQLAAAFQKEPDDLFFELLNEPTDKLDATTWNAMIPKLLGKIRPTNPSRVIIVGPGEWNNARGLKDLQLPEDPNVVVTFHFYDPFRFTHQGASWVQDKYKNLKDIRWPEDDQAENRIRKVLDDVQAWGIQHKKPIYLGEFGAYQNADLASRARWTAFVRTEAEKRQFGWCYWELAAGFGVFDLPTRSWKTDLKDSLLPRR